MQTSLFTYIGNSPISTYLLQSIIKRTAINDRYILSDKNLGDPLYVAHYCGKDLKSGVTSSKIDTQEFDKIKLREAIQQASIIVVETNLSELQIKEILQICSTLPGKKRKVLASIVSAAKSKKLFNQNFVYPFEVVSMNAEEAAELGFILNTIAPPDPNTIKQFCSSLNTRNIFVTMGKDGYYYFKSNGVHKHVGGWVNSPFLSDLGAGDALFSAVCYSCSAGLAYDSLDTESKIKGWVTTVLNKKESNLVNFPSDLFQYGVKSKKVVKTYLITLIGSLVLFLFAAYYNIVNQNALLAWFCYMFIGASSGAMGGVFAEYVRIQKNTNASIENSTLNTDKRNSSVDFSVIAIIGLIAGFIASILYLAPHLSVGNREDTFPNSTDGMRTLMILIVPVAFSAGLISDAFLKGIGVGEGVSGLQKNS